jgi:hypothetical protein
MPRPANLGHHPIHYSSYIHPLAPRASFRIAQPPLSANYEFAAQGLSPHCKSGRLFSGCIFLAVVVGTNRCRLELSMLYRVPYSTSTQHSHYEIVSRRA